MSPQVTPWWEVLKLRDEIVHSSGSIDDVQMSLFQAVHGTVKERPAYARAAYFGEITHPSPLFTDLMAKVAVRLGGGDNHTRARALWRLDQAMGGGKSHGLIGLWHLATDPSALGRTDVGREAIAKATAILDEPPAADLNNPQVVVLACDNMTAGKAVAAYDGPAQTLYERFLWRLFGGDNALYLRYKDFNGDKSKIIEALTAVGRPVLILVDEILDYIRQLSDTQLADLAVKDMAFLRALLDSVNDVPNVAAVVVMIASEKDHIDLDEVGQNRRNELEDLLIRNGEPATINDNTDFAAILRRRLFDGATPAEVLAATAREFTTRMTGPWRDKVFKAVPATASPEFPEEVARCYPFHPQLMALAEQEWATLAGFQRVRSTIRIFAATAYALHKRGKAGQWAPLLVSAGDLPLSDPAVREAVIGSGLIVDTRTQANYRQIASADVVAADDRGGAARTLDRQRTGVVARANPRAAERAATCLFLCSVIGARGGGRQGATEAELKAAMFVPDSAFPIAEADSAIAELLDVEGGGLASVEHLAGKGGQPARLFMSTRQTLNMLARSARSAVGDPDRDVEVARAAERLAATGPFKNRLFVSADPDHSALDVLATAGIDDARSTRLVVLDPRQFSLHNGVDQETRAAVRAAMGIGPDKLPVRWASSAVFAIVNTQRRGQARGAAVAYLGWDRVAAMDAVRADGELAQQAQEEKAEARRRLDAAVRRAYQHVLYLGEGDAAGHPRVERILTFEQENESALDGAVVWKALAEKGKAFGTTNPLDAKALLHNLNDSDYGRPLDEVRDLFWSTPRMPLLPGGDSDLQQAIFQALNAGSLRLVGADGLDRTVTRPGDIGVGQSGLRLAKAESATPTSGGTDTATAGSSAGSGGTAGATGGSASGSGTGSGDAGEAVTERELAFSLMSSLTDDTQREAVRVLLRSLSNAVDEGKVSYTQIMLKVIADSSAVDSITEEARQAGANPTIKDL